MKAVRQTAQNGVKLLAAFYEAHGAEQMALSYGWPHAPASVRYDRLWAYYDAVPRPLTDDRAAELAEPGKLVELYETVLVGWGGMSLDPRDASDDEASLSVGVFPDYQRRGYRHLIYDHMCDQAKKRGADRASLIVLKSNEAQYDRHMREAHTAGSAWIYAGDTWYPAPGYGYFVRPL